MSRVLVTGAAGFIGRHVCEALAHAGHGVLGVDRNAPAPSFPGDFERLDIAASTMLASVCNEVTHIVHLAALASVEESTRDPARSTRDTLETTRRLLGACKSFKQFLLASTAAVYLPDAPVPQREDVGVGATNAYAVAKLASERLVREAGGVALRLFNVYGAGQQQGIVARLVEAAKSGTRLHIQGDGEQTRDFLHVRDASRAFLLALGSDVQGMAINIGSGDEISINGLVRLGQKVSGRAVAVEYINERPGDLRRSCADVSLARQRLGYASSIKLADGLAELLAR